MLTTLKLPLLFFITALVYATVGFGGGSTYSALLVLAEVDYLILPSIALCCNIIVVTGGTWRFQTQGFIPWHQIWPLMICSVPMAWVGGQIPISQTVFIVVLAFVLLLSGISMMLQNRIQNLAPQQPALPIQHPLAMPLVGGGLGFISGLVGIGGGIFLAPILYLSRWGTAQHIAGVCAAFILVNSISGLLGQLDKLHAQNQSLLLFSYWPLFVAVFIGGQLGSYFAIKQLRPETIRFLTAGLILFVAIRLLWRSAADFQLL